jgi:hypothetical protein
MKKKIPIIFTLKRKRTGMKSKQIARNLHSQEAADIIKN